MKKASKWAATMFHRQRYIGFFLIIVGIPTIIINKPTEHAGPELPLMFGLFTLFFSTEKVEDERSVHIRTTSLYIAFVVAYTIKLLLSNLYSYHIVAFNLTEINHFIILIFTLAIVIYHFRFRIIKA